MKTFFCKLVAFATVAMVAVSTAHANSLGFNGAYDYASWSNTINVPGATLSPAQTVIDPTQQTLTLFEPDSFYNGGITASNQNFGHDFSHTVVASGTVSFDWSFDWTIDACCSGADFYVNGTLYNLANGYNGNPYNNNTGFSPVSGSFSVVVNAGDTITFEAFSADNCCGPAHMTITNFNAPSAVPEPSSLALLSLGGISLVAAAYRRRRTVAV